MENQGKSQRLGFVGVAFLSEEEGGKFIQGLEIPEGGRLKRDEKKEN